MSKVLLTVATKIGDMADQFFSTLGKMGNAAISELEALVAALDTSTTFGQEGATLATECRVAIGTCAAAKDNVSNLAETLSRSASFDSTCRTASITVGSSSADASHGEGKESDEGKENDEEGEEGEMVVEGDEGEEGVENEEGDEDEEEEEFELLEDDPEAQLNDDYGDIDKFVVAAKHQRAEATQPQGGSSSSSSSSSNTQ